MTQTPSHAELCVIGAGAAGLAVALEAAAVGASVVLIERHRTGGTHIHAGDVAARAFTAAARRAHEAAGASSFGVKPGRINVQFTGVNDHIQSVVVAAALDSTPQRLTALGIRLIEGDARFTGPAAVAVGDIEVRARRFVIATGSSSIIPDIPGLADTPYLTSETIFEVRERPKHLIILGAGPTGVELAQAFRRLGSEVTLIDNATPLAGEDPEAARIVLDALLAEGVTIHRDAAISQVRRNRSRVEIALAGPDGDHTIDGSDLLVATGRRPALEGLGLGAANIRHSHDTIAVGRRLRTSNSRVYAIGDAIGAGSTSAARHQARRVIRHALFGEPARGTDVPLRILYTDPEVAQAGLTETQARDRHKTIRIVRWPLSENDRARAERRTDGHLKVITDGRGVILGATIIAAHAGELILPWVLAIKQRQTIRVFAGIMMPYPALGEISARTALIATHKPAGRPFWHRVRGWLR